MIERDEIDARAAEFGIHTSNLQRDYIFGWLLNELYQNAYLSSLLILKGGNAFRKGFFPETRFSSDLDFSTREKIDLEKFVDEINNCCKAIHVSTGVNFDTDRSVLTQDRFVNEQTSIYKAKVYFDDFYGEKSTIVISVRMDVTEFDRLILPEVRVPLIHPYSDASACKADIVCMALEELLANKLKCLIQRRHSHDLYDLVYSLFFEHAFEIDRRVLIATFLKKTIYDSSPGSAKQILLGIPVPFFKAAWNKYIVCPSQSMLEFDSAFDGFQKFVGELFEIAGGRIDPSLAFYPAEMRNIILEAGASQKLLRLNYKDALRIVEPYSLAYKRRKDGVAQEYFYCYDRVGGNSGPGIKALLNPHVSNLEISDERFEPRFEIELGKAGDADRQGHFQKKFGGGRAFGGRTSRRSASRVGAFGVRHVVKCPVCQKEFTRKTRSTSLNKHKNNWGGECAGRSGYYLGIKI